MSNGAAEGHAAPRAEHGRRWMLKILPSSIRGALSFLLFLLNTVVWILPLLLFHFLKSILPRAGWRSFWARRQHQIGTLWTSFNNWTLGVTNPVRWDVRGLEGLMANDWCLVLANHQTWVDILVLQRILNRRVPFMKFLLKRELFWVPLLGLAWWSLDYPFLERSSTPAKDLDTILKASEKFKVTPVSIMVFAEGTRFTQEKRERQGARFRHVLKPKVGGLTAVFQGMGTRIGSILDVTIAYPGGAPTFWDFLCGRTDEVRVQVEVIPMDPELVGDFAADKEYRRRITGWLNDLWARKDQRMATLLGASDS
jgi:1-acyl-sn-glycerol-3-phosphate acyltransferase